MASEVELTPVAITARTQMPAIFPGWLVQQRKVNRHVQYRANGKLKPGTITSVGTGENVTIRIGHAGGTASNVPLWKRSTPATAGWVR